MNAPTQTPNGNAVVRRPQPTDFKPLQELTVGQLLEDPRVFQAMADSVPQHLSPQRLLRVMAQALRKTPKLGLCHPLSLLGAMISCATLGLEPNTPLGHCYLIPFAKRVKDPQTGQWHDGSYEINLIIGYQGLIDLARRSGNLVAIHADVVYEGDFFEYEYGTDMHLRHVPNGESRDNRKPLFGYSIAKLSDGFAFEVLAYPEVLKIRDNTQAYRQAMEDKARSHKGWERTPWIAYEHEMVCKTMVRRLAKWLPKSIEFASAIQMDSLAERGLIDFKAIAAQPSLAGDPDAAQIEDNASQQQSTQQPAPKQQQAESAPQQQAAPAKPKETKTKAAPPAPKPEDTEQAQREADRMTRAQMEGEPIPTAEQADDFDAYLDRMLGELRQQTGPKMQAEVERTFRDTVLGAHERGDITEARANELLGMWKKHAIVLAPKQTTQAPPEPTTEDRKQASYNDWKKDIYAALAASKKESDVDDLEEVQARNFTDADRPAFIAACNAKARELRKASKK